MSRDPVNLFFSIQYSDYFFARSEPAVSSTSLSVKPADFLDATFPLLPIRAGSLEKRAH
jgi:hypothetical protein